MDSNKKFKHLTREDRYVIEKGLTLNKSFCSISKDIQKDPTTISKEVKNHIVIITPSTKRYDRDGNDITDSCPKLDKPPYVCNGCEKFSRRCIYTKKKYIADKAQDEYKNTLSESREGIALNKQSFWDADALIKEKIDAGQRLYQIVETNDLGFNISTAYRYRAEGKLSVSPMKFPRLLKFKGRKKETDEYVPSALKKGRSFNDFEKFIKENNISQWVEMDTVIGKSKAHTCLLTFCFRPSDLMFGKLISSCCSDQVTQRITEIKKKFSTNNIRFGDVFYVAITDNGGEFNNIYPIETDLEGNKETFLFFCNPYSSWQKPAVEKDHSILRDYLPKGSSFDWMEQEDVDIIFSHMNSAKRAKHNGRSYYDYFCFLNDERILDCLNISKIADSEVIQNDQLTQMLKQKRLQK